MSTRRASSELDQAAARVIRAARNEVSLSQERLAELAGLHRTYLSLLERNRRSPTLATLELIAHALGMTPAKFIGLIAKAAVSSAVHSCAEEALSMEPRNASSSNADR